MKWIACFLAVTLTLLLSGCGHEAKRAEGSNFDGDIRDKSSRWKNEK